MKRGRRQSTPFSRANGDQPAWMNRAERLASEHDRHRVSASGERIYPLELPPEQRQRFELEEAIRRKMLVEFGGDPGFGTVPATAELARLCSLDLGREVSAETIRDYLAHGDFDDLRPVWNGYSDDDIAEIKATLMKEIL